MLSRFWDFFGSLCHLQQIQHRIGLVGNYQDLPLPIFLGALFCFQEYECESIGEAVEMFIRCYPVHFQLVSDTNIYR
jgi:UDP-galactopyranose mutase